MTDRLPPITIAIPFYNAESTLLNAIKSVFAQTHQDWELLLVDDGSSDASLKIAQSVFDSRVRVYSDGKNKRLAHRLNQVTDLANYDYIARMDADDLMLPTRIERLLKILHSDPQYDLISCGTYSIGADDNLIGYRGKDEAFYTFDGLLKKQQGFLHAGLVARRDWYRRNKYDETMKSAQDTELWIRAAKGGDFRALSISDPLYIYREEESIKPVKLLRSYRSHRQKIAPHIDNRIQKFNYIFKYYIKALIVKLFSRSDFLMPYFLMRRNNLVLSEKMKDNFNSVMKTIDGIEFNLKY